MMRQGLNRAIQKYGRCQIKLISVIQLVGEFRQRNGIKSVLIELQFDIDFFNVYFQKPETSFASNS